MCQESRAAAAAAAAAAARRAPSPRRASAESAIMRPFPRPAQRRGALRPPRPATGSRRPTRPRRATDVPYRRGRARLRCAPGRQPPRCRCSARRCRPAARHPVGGHVFEYFTTRKHALSRRTISRVSPLSRACWVALTSGPLSLCLSPHRVRLPHTRHGSRSPVITVAAAQRARGARDGGAEQRPLARSLLRLSRSAVCAGCASGEGASVAARDARRRRRAAERSVRGEAAGRGRRVTGQGISPHPAVAF